MNIRKIMWELNQGTIARADQHRAATDKLLSEAHEVQQLVETGDPDLDEHGYTEPLDDLILRDIKKLVDNPAAICGMDLERVGMIARIALAGWYDWKVRHLWYCDDDLTSGGKPIP